MIEISFFNKAEKIECSRPDLYAFTSRLSCVHVQTFLRFSIFPDYVILKKYDAHYPPPPSCVHLRSRNTSFIQSRTSYCVQFLLRNFLNLFCFPPRVFSSSQLLFKCCFIVRYYVKFGTRVWVRSRYIPTNLGVQTENIQNFSPLQRKLGET